LLAMNPSMMWHLHQVNKTWHNVFYNTLTWNAFKIVKVDNPSYHWTIQVAPKHLSHSLVAIWNQVLEILLAYGWLNNERWCWQLTFVKVIKLCTWQQFDDLFCGNLMSMLLICFCIFI
jgi:hypothetical protein